MASVGRPTKYNEEILISAQSYLNQFKGDEYQALLAKDYVDEIIPTMEGLSLWLNVSRDTLYDWKTHDDKEEFSDILRALMSKQAQLLLNQGLQGKFNHVIGKLVLSKHGYCEKTETDLTSKGESINITPTERKAKIAALLAKGKAKLNG